MLQVRTPAGAFGGAGSDTRGEANVNELSAATKKSRIQVTQTSHLTGGKQGTRPGNPVDQPLI